MERLLHLFAAAPASESITKEPIVPFLILLLVILFVPLLFERFLKVPGLVGLLAAGVVLGPQGLRVLERGAPPMDLLPEIGLVYLMFVAGLEIDMEQFRQTRNRSLTFGSFTFLVPLIMGTAVGLIFFPGKWNTSILIGSLFASHTLLAYPIVSRLGVVKNEAVTVTIGATIFTDIGALLVLAICVAIHQGDFSATRLATLIGSLVIYSVVVLFGFDRAGKEFFKRSGDDQGNQFLFVLLAVFLAAVGAQLIGVEKIVGAFLAGLAVNDAVGEGPVKEKVLFVGSVLFIPIFFVSLGLLIDIPAFIASINSITLTLAIVTGLIVSKFLAAYFAKLIYRYKWNEMLTMWSLSVPQVGATLAATLVGYEAGLLTKEVLNSVIVLLLVTATLGPLVTSRVAPTLIDASQELEPEPVSPYWSTGETATHSFGVLVPVYNPKTEQYLIEMAALLARQAQGRILPLAIAKATAHMDAPQLEAAFKRGDTLLENATNLSRELGVEAEPLLRIDDAIAQGISRAAKEQHASLIVMGWGQRTGLRARLFGNVIDSVLWAAHCPVAVSRLLKSPKEFRQILVPVENITPQAVSVLRFVSLLAAANGAHIVLLHICDRNTTPGRVAWIRSQLSLLVDKLALPDHPEIRIKPHPNVTQAILEVAKDCDLVVIRSTRRRTSAGGLTIADTTTQLIGAIACSLIMLGEPQPASFSASSEQQAVRG
ncbi:cation:proton antiporter [Chroococcidiopsis sp. CCNUC1]|uniref:cation:proton antiporter domain-containing protein n=1 Tax=Chroococcidiopsis sp. CCNUC1 TaxID=2653189 RepID=UPI00202255D0|nr:cation:proton antiporter [Chroococcidiopsis sp. CCNUC1]URD48757.1 cation:proton antiporter [Chroococcidiopsis sp. CCNUC1]